MIETKVPKDIRKFKGKAIGIFTFRQVVCISSATIADIIVYNFILKNFRLNSDLSIIILLMCSLPILIFMFEPNGIKMEVYIRTVIYKNFLYPNKRKSITKYESKRESLSEDEIKQINKHFKKNKKKRPEWRMYQ